jgi:hypothetical protein
MAKFKYIGDPNDKFRGDNPATIHGQTFVMGEVSADFPEKTEDDKALVQKLRSHSHLVDMSDKDTLSDVQDREKALEKNAREREKAEDEQRKKDEADERERQANLAKELKRRGDSALTAENAPRPPGTVTREPVTDAFGGRTVEERTQAEDHTKAGKTKS